jgi:hypothetical protein
MKWAIVPEKEGLYRIPPLSISFFDPKNKRYRTVKSPPGTINVLPCNQETIVLHNTINKGASKARAGTLLRSLDMISCRCMPP